MYTTSDFMIPFSIFHCWVPNLWCQILLRNAESSEVVLSSSRADTKVWQAHIYFWNIKKRLTLQFTLQFFNSYHKLLPGENPPSSDPISIQSPIPSISKPQSSPHGSDPSSVKGWKDSNLTSRGPPGFAKPGNTTTQRRPHDRSSTQISHFAREIFFVSKGGYLFNLGNEIFTSEMFRIFWNLLWYSWLMAIDWQRIFGLGRWRIHNAQKVAMERSIIKMLCRM